MGAIVAGLALSFFLFGYALVYWRNADMDFMVIYNALALNDGKPQPFFDHTAYLTILSVKSWFRLLHALRPARRLFAVRHSTGLRCRGFRCGDDAGGSRRARARLPDRDRLRADLCRADARIVRDWRVALIATLAFAFSGGIAVHSRILRSELVAACPVIFALMLLIVIGRRAEPRAAARDGGRGRTLRARP